MSAFSPRPPSTTGPLLRPTDDKEDRMSEDDKKELHAKLDALIDADFLVLAALVNQLHYETFFRKNRGSSPRTAQSSHRL